VTWVLIALEGSLPLARRVRTAELESSSPFEGS
jgi:hypothetical protein